MSPDQRAIEVALWPSKMLEHEVDPASPETNLAEAYDADSMDFVDIVEVLEQRYGVQIANSEVPNIKTFGDVLRLATRPSQDNIKPRDI